MEKRKLVGGFSRRAQLLLITDKETISIFNIAANMSQACRPPTAAKVNR
jgi:hypothetical protein